ncbi:bacillithiol system redox-active protein YtxJ [Thalassobacillus hwangdonensis]|uniref:Bacillithiol system redox-active protein YtxJ n=1 Tax=Thalassobacillus hwangdonensis TaxID=546108 RepID=A0ABW3KZK0_9BACI
MSKVTILNDQHEFERVSNENNFFYLLKHSLTCPISAMAKTEFDAFSAMTDYPCFQLNVQESRALSNEVATAYSIRHESPQVLLFKNGEVIWNASHGRITEKELERSLKRI